MKLMKKLLPVVFMSGTVIASGQTFREEISLSDPAIMADPVSGNYYMTGTAGDIFVSKDLDAWKKLPWALETSSIKWVGVDHKAPSPGQIWAPELYYRNGKYYNVVTFTNPNATTEGTSHSRRSIHILCSDKPEGPYKPIPGSDEIYLPANKMAIDGTIWEEDGHTYLVYVHEWVQAGDGGIEYVELKPDFTGTIGNSHHICSASDGKWNDSSVTDGPFIFKTATGRLGMIWTSWHKGAYVQGVAYSDNGKISGKWSHSNACPVVPDNNGHGMLFRTFDGQLLMSIHDTNTLNPITQKMYRAPRLFTVDDSGDELRAVMLYKSAYGIDCPTDVVVLNPEFEYDKAAWNCESDAVNKGIASNQGGAIHGKFYENWDSKSFIGDIYQELKVPDGTYLLTAAAFRNGVIDGGSDKEACVKLYANDKECEVTGTSPAEYSVKVYVKGGKLRIGLRSDKRNYKWMGIDNVRVKYYGTEDHTDKELGREKQEVFLQNKMTGKFLHAGGEEGTNVAFSDYPLGLVLLKTGDQQYAVDTKIRNAAEYHYMSGDGYLDAGFTSFQIAEAGNGEYTISPDGVNFWGAGESNLFDMRLGSDDSPANRWLMLNKEDLDDLFLNYEGEGEKDLTYLIACPDFGRNDTRVEAWKGTFTHGGGKANMNASTSALDFNINQTVDGLPNGYYRLEARGFYRDGTQTKAVKNRQESTEELKAFLYANEKTQALMSIFDESENPALPEEATTSTKAGRIPGNLEAASKLFSAGFYNNSLMCKVDNHRLTLGVKSLENTGSTGNLTVFDNFRLYYLGEEAAAIEEIREESESIDTEYIYDLAGRKVSAEAFNSKSVCPGIYIKKGKKIIVR